jgi:ribosome biogenesis GTPase / thiamine phosphate phosphatase
MMTMSKRKISEQQQRRINEHHSLRRERSKNPSTRVDDFVQSNVLGKEQEGLVIARHGSTVELEDGQQTPFLCYLRQHMKDIVAGDRVIWQQGEGNQGVVSAILPRKTVLNRPNFHGYPKPIAANITQMIIVFAAEPEPSADLINKYLVAAELLGIAPLLLLNKIDILPAHHVIHTWIRIYESLGYPILSHTLNDPKGLKLFEQHLKEHTSILLGQSGVGKSSIIKAILGDDEIRTSPLSEATGFGKHTTSTARLYHIPTGGCLIDCPGVRNYTLWDLKPQELLYGFKECRHLIAQCKFNDCQHRHEPHCVIRDLYEKQAISKMRFDSLLTLLEKLHP